MRFQDLVLKLSQLPTGNRFQDHMNSIQKITSASYLSADINNEISGSMQVGQSMNILDSSIQTTIENTLTMNSTNQLDQL
jgi:hypothetical protein